MARDFATFPRHMRWPTAGGERRQASLLLTSPGFPWETLSCQALEHRVAIGKA